MNWPPQDRVRLIAESAHEAGAFHPSTRVVALDVVSALVRMTADATREIPLPEPRQFDPENPPNNCYWTAVQVQAYGDARVAAALELFEAKGNVK